MRLLFNRISIFAAILIVVSLTIVGWWQKERIFPAPIKTSISKGEIVPELSQVLEKSGLPIFGQPTVLGDSVIASISGVRVLFGIDKDLTTQVRALQLVLGRLTINKLPKEIDLRFSKVVIRY